MKKKEHRSPRQNLKCWLAGSKISMTPLPVIRITTLQRESNACFRTDFLTKTSFLVYARPQTNIRYQLAAKRNELISASVDLIIQIYVESSNQMDRRKNDVKMKFYYLLKSALFAPLALAGCLTMSGNYVISASKDGNDLTKNLVLTAEGRGIYSVRNSICAAHPGAIVTIKSTETGKELASESPYHCR